MIRIIRSDRRQVQARALLDTCSTAHFICKDFARELGLAMRPCTLIVGAINSTFTTAKYAVDITFKSIHNDYTKTLTFVTVPTIADLIPDASFPRESISIPKNVKLADPSFHVPRPVDLLIGSGATLSLLSIGQINISREGCDLILQKTWLGWVIVCGVVKQDKAKFLSCKLTEHSKQIALF